MLSEVAFQLLLMLDSTIRLAAPLVLAAMAGLFCERAGVVDIALEGKMLGAAFAAAAVAQITGSAWLGLLAGMAFGVGLAMVHGFASITHRGDQVVSGMALNVIAAGLGPTLADAWFRQAGRVPVTAPHARFVPIDLPLADAVAADPRPGPDLRRPDQRPQHPGLPAALLVPLVAWVVYRTRFGLRLRAVGENPAAVDTAGISVGACATGRYGHRGAVRHRRRLPVDRAERRLHPRHDGGQGLSGARRPDLRQVAPGAGAALACLLFAFTDALQARLQGVPLPGIGPVPVQLIQALPYLLTISCSPASSASRGAGTQGASASPTSRSGDPRPWAQPAPRPAAAAPQQPEPQAERTAVARPSL